MRREEVTGAMQGNVVRYEKRYLRRNREIKQIINKLNSINNLKTVMIMKKEMYVAPELEVLEVMVEQGFAASPGGNIAPGGSNGEDAPDLF